MARWKLAHRQHLKFCHFQPVHCASKNPVSPKAFNRFSKSLPQVEDIEVGHLGRKDSGAQVVLLLQWQGENFAHRKHLKFCHFQPVHCARKNPISSTVFNRFSKSLPQLEDVEGGHLGGKVSGAQVFYFCNGKVKTLHIENIWNFATFNLYTVPAKIDISPKVFNRFSKSLPQLEDIEVGHLGRKVAGAQVFYFFNGKVNTLRIDNIWNFATFNLYTVPAKSQYLKRYSIDFRNLGLSSKMLRVGIWVQKVSGAQVFYFCNGKVKTLRIDNIWNFATFNLYTVRAKILHLQRHSTDFRNLCLRSKMLRLDICVGSFRCAGILLFQWQCENLAHRQHLKFCHFQPVHCASKNPYIFNGIPPIFEIFASARRCWVWAFVWEVSGAQVFYFCNGKVKTLHIENIWNFATFNLYTMPAKTLYLQRYSTDFRNLCLSSKMLRVDIWVESFRCPGILLLQWQGRKLSEHRQHLKFCHFQPVQCAAKIQYLQRNSTDFRNLCLSSKMLRVGIWADSFRCARVLLLKWQGENFAHEQHLKFCHFQPGHCASKNPISSTVFNRFSKSLPQLEDIEGGHLGGKFQVRTCFTFKMGRLKLRAWTTFEILPISTWTLCQKNPITPKVFNRFSKSSPQLEDVEGGHLGG